MEAAASATEAAASTTASIGVIGDQGCGEQDESCESNENTTKHGSLSPFEEPPDNAKAAAGSLQQVDLNQR
jgi:hypothetical protein